MPVFHQVGSFRFAVGLVHLAVGLFTTQGTEAEQSFAGLLGLCCSGSWFEIRFVETGWQERGTLRGQDINILYPRA